MNQKPRKKAIPIMKITRNVRRTSFNSKYEETRNTSLTFSKMNLWYRINLVILGGWEELDQVFEP